MPTSGTAAQALQAREAVASHPLTSKHVYYDFAAGRRDLWNADLFLLECVDPAQQRGRAADCGPQDICNLKDFR